MSLLASTATKAPYSMSVHCAVMDLFRPFLEPENQNSFRNYLPLPASPQTIFVASAKQLKGEYNDSMQGVLID